MSQGICPMCRTTWSPTCPMCGLQTQARRQRDESMQRAIKWLETVLPRSSGQMVLPSDEMGIVELVARAIEHGTEVGLTPPAAPVITRTPEEERTMRFKALELEDNPLTPGGMRTTVAMLGLGKVAAVKLELDDALSSATVEFPLKPIVGGRSVEETFFGRQDENQIRSWLKANEFTEELTRRTLVRTFNRKQQDRLTYIKRGGVYHDGMGREAAADLARIREEEGYLSCL